MKERIRRACTEITPQMLAEVRRSFPQRINNCLQVKGHHFDLGRLYFQLARPRH